MRALGAALIVLAASAVPTSGRAASEPPPEHRTLAVTVDDLPATPATDLAEMRRITAGVLAALRKHHATAVGFVNESRLAPEPEREARVALLRQWLEAGHDLGNHTFSHADLQTTPIAAYEREVMRGEEETRRLLAKRDRAVRFFRHPYNHTGPTLEARRACEAFLAAHGYSMAPFSIEGFDYGFDLLHRQALERKDRETAARLQDAYVAHTLAVTAYMEKLARRTFGRAIPQILLCHASALNAEALDFVLAALAARGYRFVPLDEALRDEAWHTPDLYVGPNGPSWLHRFQLAEGRPLTIAEEPDPPPWVLDAYGSARTEVKP